MLVAVVPSLYCVDRISHIKHEIASVEIKTVAAKQTIKRYRELDTSFGVGSETFYASKPIIFLRAGGDSESITVYRDKADANVVATPSSMDITGTWGKWQGTSINYTIKPSEHAGYYTVHFEDRLNGDAFDVLAVVQ